MSMIERRDIRFFIIDERFGPIAVVWSADPEPSVERVILSSSELPVRSEVLRLFPRAETADDEKDLPPAVGEAVGFIRDILAGRRNTFPLEKIPLWKCGSFQRRVLTVEHGIPAGSVGTYGDVVRASGSPKAVRAAGSALARNPFPLLIPCHRAVRSDGGLGGYQGGLAMKRYLLEREGVSFLPNGKVDMKGVRYSL